MDAVHFARLSPLFTFCSVVLTVCLLARTTSTTKTMELKSNAITSTSERTSLVGRQETRTKRSLFSSGMQQQLVDKHNNLRRLEPASDMEYMVWNDYLALMAEDWAKTCRWEHGQPSRPAGEPPYDQLGQNLYVYNGTFDPLHGIQAFYDEVRYYDYETGACSKPPCGHYTQVVWSTSRELGCAYAYCSSMINIDLINANYLVCNYGPPGNYVGQKPYKKGGAPCTQCNSGQFWCDDRLCRADCTRQSTKCRCAADCKNCATTVSGNCTCACAPGWTGSDCSERCEDRHEYCGANPGWPISWCDKDYVRKYCPAMCALCTVSTGGDTCKTPLPTQPTTATTTGSNNKNSTDEIRETGGSSKVSPRYVVLLISTFLLTLLS